MRGLYSAARRAGAPAACNLAPRAASRVIWVGIETCNPSSNSPVRAAPIIAQPALMQRADSVTIRDNSGFQFQFACYRPFI
jgi:hypothetical protein